MHHRHTCTPTRWPRLRRHRRPAPPTPTRPRRSSSVIIGTSSCVRVADGAGDSARLQHITSYVSSPRPPPPPCHGRPPRAPPNCLMVRRNRRRRRKRLWAIGESDGYHWSRSIPPTIHNLISGRRGNGGELELFYGKWGGICNCRGRREINGAEGTTICKCFMQGRGLQ